METCLIKRVKTLKKKTFELSTLCGVDAVLIISENDGPKSELHTWPESPEEVRRILQSYHDCEGQPRKRRKISDVNLDAGDQEEIINNATRENSTVEAASAEEAKMFLDVLDSKLSMVNARIRELKGEVEDNLDTKAIWETNVTNNRCIENLDTKAIHEMNLTNNRCIENAEEWEGIQYCGGTEVGSCSVTASDWNLEALLLEDQTISPTQFLMDGINLGMGYDPLFLSHPWDF